MNEHRNLCHLLRINISKTKSHSPPFECCCVINAQHSLHFFTLAFYFNALMFTYSICSSLTLIILLCSASYPLSQCHTKFACTMGVHFYPIIFLYFISALLYVSFSLRLLSFNLWFQLFPLYFWNPTRSWAVHASDQWNQCFEKPNTPYFLWRFRFTNLGKMHFSFFRLPKKICRKVIICFIKIVKEVRPLANDIPARWRHSLYEQFPDKISQKVKKHRIK